mmetsp:Transcript_25586/g.39600  ORF Transcript_25586/g.39600 Transcript_25586/m.39600 type:complete len:221 (+) Transcript_25586:111-773(+)
MRADAPTQRGAHGTALARRRDLRAGQGPHGAAQLHRRESGGLRRVAGAEGTGGAARLHGPAVRPLVRRGLREDAARRARLAARRRRAARHLCAWRRPRARTRHAHRGRRGAGHLPVPLGAPRRRGEHHLRCAPRRGRRGSDRRVAAGRRGASDDRRLQHVCRQCGGRPLRDGQRAARCRVRGGRAGRDRLWRVLVAGSVLTRYKGTVYRWSCDHCVLSSQ